MALKGTAGRVLEGLVPLMVQEDLSWELQRPLQFGELQVWCTLPGLLSSTASFLLGALAAEPWDDGDVLLEFPEGCGGCSQAV